MKRETLMQNPLPVDRVAARVVGKSRDVGLTPAVNNAWGRHVEWDIAPPIRPPKASLRHWVGMRLGRLTLLGKLDYVVRPDKPDHNPRWVCRCDCGVFVVRNTPAIRAAIETPDSPDALSAGAWKCRTCLKKWRLFGR